MLSNPAKYEGFWNNIMSSLCSNLYIMLVGYKLFVLLANLKQAAICMKPEKYIQVHCGNCSLQSAMENHTYDV